MDEQQDLALLFTSTLFEHLYRSGFTHYRTSKASLDQVPSIKVNDPDAKRCLIEFFNTFYLPSDDPLILRFHTLDGRIRPWVNTFPKPERVIPALLDQDMFVRFTAITVLGKIGWPAPSPLLSALETGEWMVRGGATHAIGIIAKRGEFGRALGAVDMQFRGMGEPAIRILAAMATDGFVRLLDDSSGYVRACAAGALGTLRQQRTIDPLIERIADAFGPVRCLAVESLGTIGGSRAFDAMLQATNHPDADVRESAARSLGQIHDRRALPRLREVSQFWNPRESRHVKKAAYEAIRRIERD